MLLRSALFMVSVPLVVSACEREAVAPADVAPADAEVPAFSWMNNPDNGNIRIARFQEDFALSWTDPRNGLRATHSTVPLPIGLPQETGCGPQEVLDPLDVQDVGIFMDGDEFLLSWLHRNMKGGLWVIVRDVNQAGDCFGNKLIAEGPGRMHYTDNDLFGTQEGDKNSNAWGFGASGVLTTPDGRTVRYEGHARFTVGTKLDDEGFPIFKHEDFLVNIH